MTRAVAAALLLALAAARAAGAPGDDGAAGSRDGGQPPPDPPDAGPVDPDQELIDHLDEIRDLDLLRNLELFDPGDDAR